MRQEQYLTHFLSRAKIKLLFITGLLLAIILVRLTLSSAQEEGEVVRQPVRHWAIEPRLEGAGPRPPATQVSDEVEVIIETSPSVPVRNCTTPSEYWVEHPEDWPVDNIQTAQFRFERDTLQQVFQDKSQDLVTVLVKQFLTTVFNVLAGAEASPVEPHLNEASQWIDRYIYEPVLSENELAAGQQLLQILQDYNMGLVGPGICPEYALAAAPTETPVPSATPVSTSALASGFSASNLEIESSTDTEPSRRQRGRRQAASDTAPDPTSPAAGTPVVVEPPAQPAGQDPVQGHPVPTQAPRSPGQQPPQPQPSGDPDQGSSPMPTQTPRPPHQQASQPNPPKNPGRSNDPEPTREAPPNDPPGHSNNPPGPPNNPPGQSNDPPGPPNNPPGHSNNPPGHSNDPPGHSNNPPGHSNDPPGHSNDPPGHSNDPPGHSNDPPGHSNDPPGHSNNPPGPPDDPPGNHTPPDHGHDDKDKDKGRGNGGGPGNGRPPDP